MSLFKPFTKYLKIFFCIFFLFHIFPSNVLGERIFFAGYKGGFYIRSEEEGGMELRLGGAFQADYRHYLEDERSDNRFDIRRARLVFRGQLTRWFGFGMEYEFQGNEIKHLVDAYGEALLYGDLIKLKFGQFKEPFGLEWQCRDKSLWFAERSMGYYLTPKRDIGLMMHGSLYQDALNYAVGLFNGDGIDGTAGGSEHDEPEITTRLIASPFKRSRSNWLNSFQIGASASYAKIDLANIDLEVKSTGMAGSSRNLYLLQQNSKFGVLQDVDQRWRIGLETAWSVGPFAITGEYIRLAYTDLKPAGEAPRDADFSSWYASLFYCLTGEQIILSNGVIKPIYPENFFNPQEGTFGAIAVSARLEHFSGDKDWIKEDAFVSVREADAFSLALNWVLFPMHRIIFDYTHTDFTDSIRVRINPDGEIDYIDKENVFTFRFSIDF